MSTIDFLKSVVEQRFKELYDKPLIKQKDLDAALELFKNFVIGEIPERYLENSEYSQNRAQTLACDVTRLHADKFKQICLTGFPFSICKIPNMQTVLKAALLHDDSILAYCLLAAESDEEVLPLVKQLSFKEIVRACHDLKHEYLQYNNNKAGYYLLWLIKNVAGCSFDLPKQGDVNDSTVGKVLSPFLCSDKRNIASDVKFLEMVVEKATPQPPFFLQFLDFPSINALFSLAMKCFQEISLDQWPNKVMLIESFLSWQMDTGMGKPLLQLSEERQAALIRFALEQFEQIPADKWPNKVTIIKHLLLKLPEKAAQTMATALANSKDRTLVELSKLVGIRTTLDGLNPQDTYSTYSMMRIVNPLEEQFPFFNAIDLVNIRFGYAFPKLCIEPASTKFAKKVVFHTKSGVFVHQSRMIGVYHFPSRQSPDSLLAYDMYTERLVWSVPLSLLGLTAEQFSSLKIHQVGDRIAFQLTGEKLVHFVHSETGEHTSFFMPESYSRKEGGLSIHLASQGYTYQEVWEEDKEVFVGGKIENDKWTQSFKTAVGLGDLLPLSTHCGFYDVNLNQLVVFGPTGHHVKLDYCSNAYAKDSKLFTITTVKRDPLNTKLFLLTVQTLKLDEKVVSEVEKYIPLEQCATIGKLCKNDQLVLFAQNGSPIFVDVKTGKMTYSTFAASPHSSNFIDEETGAVWNANLLTQEVWKVTPEKTKLMGSASICSEHGQFLYVNKDGPTYFKSEVNNSIS